MECRELAGLDELESFTISDSEVAISDSDIASGFPVLDEKVEDTHVYIGDPRSLFAADLIRGFDRQSLRDADRVARKPTQYVSRDHRSSADREQLQQHSYKRRRPGDSGLTRSAILGTSTSEKGG